MREWIRKQVRAFALWLLAWVDACPVCGAPWREHRCPYVVKTVGRECGICRVALPVDAIRTHEGHWRCREHKNEKG